MRFKTMLKRKTVQFACLSALLCIFVVMLSVPLPAQVERASLVGTIRDNTGAIVPNVEVRITHETTNVTVTVHTNQTGDFAAVDLIPGSYSVVAAHAGFSTRSYK